MRPIKNLVSNSMKKNLNIFTCCNIAYQDFIPLFAFSHLYYNPDATVEIGLENIKILEITGEINAIKLIENYFGKESLLLRQVNFTCHNGRSINPATVRFITEPQIKLEYTYISDIDILNLEKISDKHIPIMLEKKMLYSNIVRPNEPYPRLTGLHFFITKTMYPLPEMSDLDISNSNDENILFNLVKKKGIYIDHDYTYRPIHGFHPSPNRKVRADKDSKIPGWSGIDNTDFVEQYKTLIETDELKKIYPYLSLRIKKTIAQLNQVIKEL